MEIVLAILIWIMMLCALWLGWLVLAVPLFFVGAAVFLAGDYGPHM